MENGNTLAGFDPRSEMGNQSQLFINLHQDIICTTKDKLQLSLQRFQAAQEIKSTVSACASLTLTCTGSAGVGVECSVSDRFGGECHRDPFGAVSAVPDQKGPGYRDFLRQHYAGQCGPLQSGRRQCPVGPAGQLTGKAGCFAGFSFFQKKKKFPVFCTLEVGFHGNTTFVRSKRETGLEKREKKPQNPRIKCGQGGAWRVGKSSKPKPLFISSVPTFRSAHIRDGVHGVISIFFVEMTPWA